MTDTLRPVLVSIERTASSIERTFLNAGDSLSRGLDVFSQFGTDLSAFSRDFDASGMTDASSSLESLARELVLISKAMPEDAATLKELAETNDVIVKRLADLLENARMMATLARSARIEAVAFTDGSGLESFTQDIAKLTNTVQQDISVCAMDHAKFTEMLRAVTKAQLQLDRTYRDKLLILAQDLSETFNAVGERQRAGVDLMQDVAARSNQISQSSTMALIALQAGDSTRQRLEHVASAVSAVIALEEEQMIPALPVPDEARQVTAIALCELQYAQLQDCVDCFSADVRDIDRAIEALITDTSSILDRSRNTYGSQADGVGTFLAQFRTKLIAAGDLLKTCEAARRYVDRTSIDLLAMLEDLHRTITNFNTITLDLTLVGLNAGLKAIRLGSSGRSFIVIADELKRLANCIFKDSQDLLTIFLRTQEIVAKLDRTDSADQAAQSMDGDRKIASIIDGFASGDRRMTDFLTTLEQKALSFDADLVQARKAFAVAEAMNGDILNDAEVLNGYARGDDDADVDLSPGLSFIDALMAPKYTMAREREIHAEHIGEPAYAGNDSETTVTEEL